MVDVKQGFHPPSQFHCAEMGVAMRFRDQIRRLAISLCVALAAASALTTTPPPSDFTAPDDDAVRVEREIVSCLAAI